MKIFEREEFLISRAIRCEKDNTERERKRAEDAEAKIKDIEEENFRLKEELRKLQAQA